MFVRNYGLFWQRDEIDWTPGRGARHAFRLLGRVGSNTGSVRMADFRHQQGIYILYGNHGPYYVGLTRRQGLGKRLKDHLSGGMARDWNRFSWFGFGKVLTTVDPATHVLRLKRVPLQVAGDPHTVIGDVEAMLIRAMGLRNVNQTKFSSAEEWIQVKAHEADRYIARFRKS